jgi:hypothetical protein
MHVIPHPKIGYADFGLRGYIVMDFMEIGINTG